MRGKSKHYDKRQVIKMDNIVPSDYTDRVILCLPRFGWMVARAFLSRQAQWRSTYGYEFFQEYYTTPDDSEFDVIRQAIDSTLAEGDMSCDITGAIEKMATDLILEMDGNNVNLVSAINSLVAKDCPGSCGGSGGAGDTEAPPIDFDDTGENYPDEFTSRVEFDEWKCGVATLIIDQFLTDLRWFQNTDILEITAEVIAFTLLTPIFGDEVIVMVGGIAILVAEGILDTILDGIIADLEADRGELICGLYNALNSSAALASLEAWIDAKLNGLEKTFMGWFVTYDVVNWLFSKPNLFLPEADCSGCVGGIPGGAWTLQLGTLVDGSLDAGTSYFEIEAGYSTSGGCNRYQSQVLAPVGVDLSIEIRQSGGVTPKCCGVPCVSGYAYDAVADLPVQSIGTDPLAPLDICQLGGQSVWLRYTEPFIMQITVIGGCNGS
jgi:hypothetical protein